MIQYLLNRSLFAFQLFPTRAKRLGKQLVRICPYRANWWVELSFLFLDLIFFFDVYEILGNLIKSRGLRAKEKELLLPIFGAHFPYHLVRIDERARLGPPQYHFYYVSFLTINGWGEIGLPAPKKDKFLGLEVSRFNTSLATLLVHEMVHVWQYLQHGAVYIPRALAAQKTEMSYNYGGLEPLQKYPSLHYFNYEQQADIIADAFALQRGWAGRWVSACSQRQLAFYAPFLAEVMGGLSLFTSAPSVSSAPSVEGQR